MSLSRRTSLVLEDEPLTTIQKTRNFMTSSQLYSTSWSKPPSSLMWLIAVTASRSYFLPTTQKPVKTKSDHAATLLQTLQWLPSKAELKPEALQTLTPVTCLTCSATLRGQYRWAALDSLLFLSMSSLLLIHGLYSLSPLSGNLFPSCLHGFFPHFLQVSAQRPFYQCGFLSPSFINSNTFPHKPAFPILLNWFMFLHSAHRTHFIFFLLSSSSHLEAKDIVFCCCLSL